MSPEEVNGLGSIAGPMHGTPFMDVTDHQEPIQNPFPLDASKAAVSSSSRIANALSKISISEVEANLKVLTDFGNRKHTTAEGREAAIWIKDKMDSYCAQYNPGRKCESTLFEHQRTNQPSTITRLEGTSPQLPIVIIGGHEDSTAVGNVAPGADDDGTGTVTVMESLRAFLEAGEVNDHTIEFHTYAAEEVGLWGSQDVAQKYAQDNVPVKSMIQFDMNGCCSPSSGLNRGTKFNVCTDSSFTNAEVTARLRTYIDEYGNGMEQGNFNYGYAASDHASWARAGYAACPVKENVNYSPIHTANDKYENIDFEYLSHFVGVGIGFAIEESNRN
jgi:leucyl aminopeptidase